MKNFFIDYMKKKKEKIIKSYNTIPKDDMKTFVLYINNNEELSPYKAALINYKNNNIINFDKSDENELRPFAKYFHCINHIKYAQKNNLTEEQVLEDIKSGKIKYIQHYNNNNKDIYIIHMWQFLN
jgi:hypothetical protein